MAKKAGKIKIEAMDLSDSEAKSLVIVESPTKAKTIGKYLGRDYIVKACRGHVRDLPPKKYGVDPGRNFEPTYEILPSHAKVLADLRKNASQAPMVFLATDLDREGEAIAWHLSQALDLSSDRIKRVVFNEITKSAIVEAFSKPHHIDMAKVDAQQARRILDRVVGYELSPLLWKKIAKGLSAGRVQSVAVRMIVDRELEIRAFEPQESWVIDGVFTSAINQAPELAHRWLDFVRNGGQGQEPPTTRERVAWFEKEQCFEAVLVEVNGQSFKAEGELKKKAGTPAESPEEAVSFHSAVEIVRPVVESLGYRVREVTAQKWDAYARLGLNRIELVGETVVRESPAFTVTSIDTKRTSSKPSGPFTTANLQQAAANQLRFSTSKTMKLAQALYEGIDLNTGEGNVGLITYMRTDSTNLSAESVAAVRRYISEHFGERYLPEKPNRYGSSKQAQEAHEAIRPTDVTRTPDMLKRHMTPEQHRLYTLIWNRFVTCQMVPAEWDATTVLLSTKPGAGHVREAVFKATGRILVFDGYYKVGGVPKNGDEPTLPPLTVGQRIAAVAIEPLQKFTAPPPRYSEASLVKSLEAEGIGRPSTYAAIIQTIQDRGYVEQADRRFHPTARGEIVTAKLVKHFPKVMDVRFTSHMENELDQIEEKNLDWHHVLHEFYDPFKVDLAKAHQEMDAVRAEPSPYKCNLCGSDMVYRFGRTGRFLSCSNYPKCQNAKDVDAEGKPIEPIIVDEKCDLCGRPMMVRRSRRGPFLGCTGYPECASAKPCAEDGTPLRKIDANDIKQTCPECSSPMQVKFARGRAFLGCSAYPTCKGTAPMPEGVYVEKPKPQEAGARCDKCGRPMVIRRSRRGPFLSCSGFPKCRNAMAMEKLEHLQQLETEGKIPEAPAASKKDKATPNGGPARGRKAAGGKAKRLSKEEMAALGTPPVGFAWTLTGRPVVEVWPSGPLGCFECGGEMTLRHGRFGPFFSCDKCRAVANLRGEAKKQAEAESPAPPKPKAIPTEVACPDCGAFMMLRMGKTGRFLGCSAYPKCRKTMEAPPGLLREVASSPNP